MKFYDQAEGGGEAGARDDLPAQEKQLRQGPRGGQAVQGHAGRQRRQRRVSHHQVARSTIFLLQWHKTKTEKP